MDVLFTIATLGLMAAAIVVLGRAWPRSSRGGGYRAGRGHGAGGAGRGANTTPPVPEEEDARWRWSGGSGSRDGGSPGGPGGPGTTS